MKATGDFDFVRAVFNCRILLSPSIFNFVPPRFMDFEFEYSF